MSIFTELKYSLRSVTKSFGFTLLSVVMLGLGLGATIFMFTAIKAYVLTGLPFHESERIMHVERQHESHDSFNAEISMHELIELRRAQNSFEDLSGYYTGTVNLSDEDLPVRLDGAFITGNAFEQLRVSAFMGRTLSTTDSAIGAEPAVTIGYNMWQYRYNEDPQIVGKVIRVNSQARTIVGVMPEGFKFPTQEEIWIPLAFEATAEEWGGGTSMEVFGRLEPGVTIEQAKADLDGIFASMGETHPDTNSGMRAVVKKFADEYIDPNQKAMIWIMFGIVFAVLLVACANMANLLLARTAARQRELAIRSALGAGRWRIAINVLSEALIVSFAGAAVGVWLARMGLDGVLYALAAADLSEPFWVSYAIDARVVIFAFFAAFFAAMVAGLAPALRASRTDVNENLKDGSKGSAASVSTLSQTLVVGEIAVSCALLIAAGVMVRSVMTLNDVDLGVNYNKVLTARVGLMETDYPEDTQAQFFQELVDRLEGTPGVVNAAATVSVPGMWGYTRAYETPELNLAVGDQRPATQWVASTPEYFELMDIKLIDGRLFDSRDGPDTQQVAIVDQDLVNKHWPGESAIGKQIMFDISPNPDPQWLTIIGVVSNTHHDEIDDPARPTIYQPIAQQPARFMTVMVRTEGPPMAFGNTMREVVQSIDPNLPIYWLRTVEDWIAIGMFAANIMSTLFAIFALVGVVLAAAGIYGVLAYSVNLRTREIGVRRALGAENNRILGMVLKQSAWQLGIGMGIGLVFGLLISFALARFWVLAKVFDPVMFGVVATFLAMVAFAAALFPALRATRIHPMEALRYE